MRRFDSEAEVPAAERDRRDRIERLAPAERRELRAAIRDIELPAEVYAAERLPSQSGRGVHAPFPTAVARAGVFALDLVPAWEAAREEAGREVHRFHADLLAWSESAPPAGGVGGSINSQPLTEQLLAQRALRHLAEASWTMREDVIDRLLRMFGSPMSRGDADAHLERFLDRVEPSLTPVEVLWDLAQVPTADWPYELAGHAKRSADRWEYARDQVERSRLPFEVAFGSAHRASSDAGTAQSTADHSADVTRMLGLLRNLSPEDREMVASHACGVTYEQLADRFGIPRATLHEHHTRLIHALRMNYHRATRQEGP